MAEVTLQSRNRADLGSARVKAAGNGIFIQLRTWMLLKDAVGVLLEGTPSDVNFATLRDAIKNSCWSCRRS